MYRIKTPDGTNKYDIDSIMNEHLFYSKLVFNEMGGSAHELTRYNINELDSNEKEMLVKDISLDEISKVVETLSICNKNLLLLIYPI